MSQDIVLKQEEGFFKITALKLYRKTVGVTFDAVPMGGLSSLKAIDRVLHDHGAYSPGSVGAVERPWYMHDSQEDNLVVLAGFRDIDLFKDGRLVHFRLSPHHIEMGDALLYDQPVMLSWSTRVFHRIVSSPEKGSASINLAVRLPGFDIRTNFSIYELNVESGEYRIIREGHLDQFGE